MDGGRLFSNPIFFLGIHVRFPNFTITPITKIEKEIGYVSPF